MAIARNRQGLNKKWGRGKKCPQLDKCYSHNCLFRAVPRNQEDIKVSVDNIPLAKGGRDSGEAADWGRRTIVTLALTVLTSSQGLLIAASKAKHVRYDYSVTSANCTVNDLAARPDTHHRRPRSSIDPASLMEP